MFDTLADIVPFDEDNGKIFPVEEPGSFTRNPTSIEIRCGDGHCRRCNCSNWQPQSMNPNLCMCTHSYSDHAD